jgi:hypothetical protein
MELWTSKALEEKCKDEGSAIIRNGEFQLQDLESKRKFNINRQPWNFIMRPGKKHYISIVFKEIGIEKQSCPHYRADNETVNGQPTS